ncbi:hypothetical protein P8C59_004269 [Phyllachora maydis]|uniref:Uncharacterized protein n=1 Tax=Phyllachora maydis TaxID=1825666 RepID=A0AAD9I336_9PEZI|nr:hypothetical protein P8C59_004269 [Phyllachora maydis]
MADQAKGKGIAPKRASNPAVLGQSSRPPPPILTLLEDKEDGEDYSEVIEVLKQYIKSHKRVIASQSSDIKTLLLSLNTLKASIKDGVSAIKNISSTLASLTNSSNPAAATTGKTSYNPPIDTGSKEGFKDTITSSIVKELSKKAYTIPDENKLSRESNFKQWIQALSIVLRALGISNFLENPDISNTYSDSDQAILLMLLHNSLSSSPRAATSWIYIPSKALKLLVRQYSRPIESKKEDVYNEFHALTFSTYKKGLSAFNAEFNGYLAKLTIAKIDIDPSLILNQYFKALESKFPSWKGPPTYTKLVLDNVLYLPNIDINIVSRDRHYNSGGCLIKEILYGDNRRYIAVLDFKKSGFFLDVKRSSKPILHANFAFSLGLSSYTTKSIEPQRNKIVVEIPSNSIRKEDYRPIIEDAIVSKAIEPKKRYKLRNSPAKDTTLESIGPSLRGKRPCLCLLKKTSSITKGLPNFDKIKEADFHCSSCNRVNCKSRYKWVFKLPNKSGPIVANAIKGFFRGLRNSFSRYPTKFHFDGGTEITDLLTT